jgi:hypothetical protein
MIEAVIIGRLVIAAVFCAGAYWLLTHITIKRSDKSKGDKE